MSKHCKTSFCHLGSSLRGGNSHSWLVFPDACWAFQINLAKDNIGVEANPLFYLLVSDRPKNPYDFTKSLTVLKPPCSLPCMLPVSCWWKAFLLKHHFVVFQDKDGAILSCKARVVAAGQLLTSLLLFAVPAEMRPVCSEEKSIFLYFVLSQSFTIY